MAYHEQTFIRIIDILSEQNILFKEKAMFGGICIMVDEKMCCGLLIDKKRNEELLMCRLGEIEATKALEQDHVIPMEFTGRPMKDYVFVTPEGMNTKKKLEHWLQLCIDYNPMAKKSKR